MSVIVQAFAKNLKYSKVIDSLYHPFFCDAEINLF